MKEFAFFFGFIMTLSIGMHGQTPTDMLRFSEQNLSSTARSLGVSNSNGALGGDFGAIHQNPASLGIYRVSEFMFTPGLHIQGADTRVLQDPAGFTGRDNNSRVVIDNIGFVIASKMGNTSNNTMNFAVGFHRLSNFNSDFRYAGETPGSIGNRFVELANGFSPNDLDPFYEGLAYQTFAIGLEPEGFDYFSDFNEDDPVFKEGTYRSEGGAREINFAYASNFDNKFSIGVKAGVPFFNFEEESLYTEFDDRDISPYFNRLEFDQYLNTTGIGFHANVGVIYAPSFPFRIGFNIQTPTWYNINEDFDNRMLYDYVDDPDIFPEAPPKEALSPEGRPSYNVTTPWRLRGQAGYLLGKSGFLSAEVEYVDYSNATFRFKSQFSNDERNLNRLVRNQLNSVINLRLGGEYAFGKFRARLGTSLRQNPTDEEVNYNHGITLGLGLREDNFFMDLGYQWRENNFQIQPYERFDEDASKTTVAVDQSRQQILLTFGFKLR